MTRLTVCFFIDNAVVDRHDMDLPSETDAREIIDECKYHLRDMEPLSPEEEAKQREAWDASGKRFLERRKERGK